MKYPFYVFVAALALVAVVFALSNRHDVIVYFWPFPGAVGPVYAWVLLTFVVGFFTGWFARWIRGLAVRHRNHVLARRTESLEKEVTELRHQIDTLEASPSPDNSIIVPPDRRLSATSQ